MNEMLTSLKEIKSLIANPETWTQRVSARDKHDQYVNSLNPNAVKWCLLGAINKVINNKELVHVITEELRYTITKELRYVNYENSLMDCNDKGTHDDVIDLLNRAIKRNRNFLYKLIPRWLL